MTTLGIGIMAHASRADRLPALIDQLGGIEAVEVSLDVAEPSRDPQQRWGTGHGAWRAAAARGAGWTLVLQDDAVLCEDFVVGATAALGQLREPGIVSFYVGIGRPAQLQVKRAAVVADRRGDSWIRMNALYWGVAVALPTRVVPQMLSWCADRRKDAYDARLARFALHQMRWPAWYTWPSLVDHADGPSLVSHSAPGRVAAKFLQGSALGVDWSKLPPSRRAITKERP